MAIAHVPVSTIGGFDRAAALAHAAGFSGANLMTGALVLFVLGEIVERRWLTLPATAALILAGAALVVLGARLLARRHALPDL
jgi:hypothetical protein